MGASVLRRLANATAQVAGGSPVNAVWSALPFDPALGSMIAQSRQVSIRVMSADLASTPAENATVVVTSDLVGVSGSYRVGQVTPLPDVGHTLIELKK
ncbi:MAG: hypothetical protein YHS30scaffold667_22 [Phage 65_10]|nr:MAG: hypothetical protein YHS30scaffold667_22 [Phage 65_10]